MVQLPFLRTSHPYYPTSARLPNYVPNSAPLQTLFAAFATACAVALSGTALVAKRLNPRLPASELLIVIWFALSYFILNNQTIPSQQTIPAQLWKEYALSDSRYLTRSSFVLSIEAITVTTWGPLSLLTAYQTATAKPHRHVLQIVVSLAHIYGATLYYLTALADAQVHGVHVSRPEPLYFWGYFVGANGFWIVVPALLIWRSCKRIARAVRAVEKYGVS